MRRISVDYENEQAEEQAEDDRVTVSLAALAFALLLVVVGLFLVQHLASKGRRASSSSASARGGSPTPAASTASRADSRRATASRPR